MMKVFMCIAMTPLVAGVVEVDHIEVFKPDSKVFDHYLYRIIADGDAFYARHNTLKGPLATYKHSLADNKDPEIWMIEKTVWTVNRFLANAFFLSKEKRCEIRLGALKDIFGTYMGEKETIQFFEKHSVESDKMSAEWSARTE